MVHRILIVTAVAAEADSVAAGLGHDAPDSVREPAWEPVPLPGGLTLRRHTDGVDLLVGGVGPAAVAAATGTALACAALAGADSDSDPDWGPGSSSGPGSRSSPGSAPRFRPSSGAPYDLVVSAGIAGGFASHAPLGTVVVSEAIVAADLGAETPDGYLAVEELGFGRSAHPVPHSLTGPLAAALRAGGLPHTVAPVLTVSTVTGTAGRAAELAGRHPTAAAEAMEGFGVAEAAAAYGVPVVEIRAVSNAVGPRDRAAWRIGEALDALRQAFALLAAPLLTPPAGPARLPNPTPSVEAK
ncbi:futalosine hydrolase [Streptomyces narbonensis]|uniref:Futalosine hydrolase n=1 Tax=Streptomyces narbonensis TaxID=67333 RepID=A0ABV3CMH7_9ACTN